MILGKETAVQQKTDNFRGFERQKVEDKMEERSREEMDRLSPDISSDEIIEESDTSTNDEHRCSTDTTKEQQPTVKKPLPFSVEAIMSNNTHTRHKSDPRKSPEGASPPQQTLQPSPESSRTSNVTVSVSHVGGYGLSPVSPQTSPTYMMGSPHAYPWIQGSLFSPPRK